MVRGFLLQRGQEVCGRPLPELGIVGLGGHGGGATEQREDRCGDRMVLNGRRILGADGLRVCR